MRPVPIQPPRWLNGAFFSCRKRSTAPHLLGFYPHGANPPNATLRPDSVALADFCAKSSVRFCAVPPSRAEPSRAVRTALFSVRHSAQNLPTPNLHFSPIKPTFSHRFFAPRKNDDPPKIGQNRAFSPLCLYHVHTSP